MVTDWGKTGRVDGYRFVLVDPMTLAEIREVPCEAGKCSVSYGYYTDNKAQADIVMLEGNTDGNRDLMVRVYHRCKCDGADMEECLGTFFVDKLGTKAANGIVRGDASCYGPLWRLTQDKLLNDFAIKKGALRLDSVRRIVEGVGGRLVVGDGVDVDSPHSGNSYIEMGESVAKAANICASSMGCRLDGAETGEILIERYVKPGLRPVVHEFVEGPTCTMVGGVDMELNSYHPTNRVKAYFSREHSGGDGFPRSDSVTVSLDPAHPFSFERTGTWRTSILTVDKPCSHADLEQKAKTYLEENSGAEIYLTIQHVGIPHLRAGDVVRYRNETDMGEPFDCDCMITELDMELGPLAMCKSRMKVVRWR